MSGVLYSDLPGARPQAFACSSCSAVVRLHPEDPLPAGWRVDGRVTPAYTCSECAGGRRREVAPPAVVDAPRPPSLPPARPRPAPARDAPAASSPAVLTRLSAADVQFIAELERVLYTWETLARLASLVADAERVAEYKEKAGEVLAQIAAVGERRAA